jgi:threonylcarbamoyladenosine tRNA methylthiotransferase MtaB
MKKVVVKTLGCKANWVDSQELASKFIADGYQVYDSEKSATENNSENKNEVEICVVNSCTVTDEADRQSRKLATKLKKLYPNSKVIMTGCSAEVDPLALSKVTGVDHVVSNRAKSAQGLQHWLGNNSENAIQYSQMNSVHPMDREWPDVGFTSSGSLFEDNLRTRHFLKVQEGCNSFCTFCVIPYGRGPSRSMTPVQVISKINDAVTSGFQEVVLTGTNLGDFGSQGSVKGKIEDLESLVEAVLRGTRLQRLRLSSLDPKELSPKLTRLVEVYSDRLCPHFHVSLQSPLTPILRGMKRGYNQEEVSECLQRIAALKIVTPGGPYVGMDIITGFPGETDELFEETIRVLESMQWQRLHVFPYSERTGTPATRMKGSVDRSVRKQRAKRLIELSNKRLQVWAERFLNFDRIENVLLEGKTSDRSVVVGHTPNYLRVSIELPKGIAASTVANQLVTVCPKSLRFNSASGEVEITAILAES